MLDLAHIDVADKREVAAGLCRCFIKRYRQVLGLASLFLNIYLGLVYNFIDFLNEKLTERIEHLQLQFGLLHFGLSDHLWHQGLL